MGYFSKYYIAIDNAHTAPQRAMDCGPGLDGVNKRLRYIAVSIIFNIGPILHRICNNENIFRHVL